MNCVTDTTTGSSGSTVRDTTCCSADTTCAPMARDASPIERLPLGVPSVHVAGDRDFIAPVAVREAYATAARARGDSARVITIVGDGHFEAMTPYKAAGRAVIDAIRGLLALPPDRR